jgi:hypothetical protein
LTTDTFDDWLEICVRTTHSPKYDYENYSKNALHFLREKRHNVGQKLSQWVKNTILEKY